LIRIRGIAWPADQYIYIAMVLVIVAASFAARGQALFISTIDWDEGVYLVMAQRWLLGGLPYVAVWDQHPPGLPALLAVIQIVIPDAVFGARLAALCAVIITALLIHRFCARYANQAGAGLIGALLYIVCISRWAGLAANTEVFNNACVTFAFYLLYGALRRSPTNLPRAIAAAAMLGVGLQIKYVVIAEAILLCLGYLMVSFQRNRDLRDLAVTGGALILAGCLPTGITILYFWAHGALRPFLDANFSSNIAYLDIATALVTVLQRSASGMAPIMGCILIIGYAMGRRVQWRRTWFTASSPQAWLLLWIIAAIADVCLPLKFFTHYYFALYPPACISGALALCVVAGNRHKNFVAGLVVLFVTAVPLWAVGNARTARVAGADSERAVAGFLRQAGARDMSIFVYNFPPVVYALAQVRPLTPYVLGGELAPLSVSARLHELEARRIMDSSPDFVIVGGRFPSEPVPTPLDEVIASRLATYHLVYETSNGLDNSIVRVYER
jgi:hypothetical protein